ncbi:MAG: hypothetical protein OK422_01415 [Thaumarchaeota archaeon]|nr:hypothetical protein [Nitrososphaerota archaeon]
MADVATTIALGTVATFVPLYFGLAIPKAIGAQTERKALALTAVSVGIIFWFFLDVMGDSTLLGVNQGLNFDYAHVLLILAFALGFVFLFGLEGRRDGAEGLPNAFTYRVAAIVALGIGFHALGEGMDIGSITPNVSSIIDAIGGVLPGTAYVIHKILEGFVVGAFAVLGGLSYKKLGVLGLISGVPTVLGFFIGLQSPFESTYFFALGGAAAVYVEMKLVPALQLRKYLWTTVVLFLVGFFLMYSAGLLHG